MGILILFVVSLVVIVLMISMKLVELSSGKTSSFSLSRFDDMVVRVLHAVVRAARMLWHAIKRLPWVLREMIDRALHTLAEKLQGRAERRKLEKGAAPSEYIARIKPTEIEDENAS